MLFRRTGNGCIQHVWFAQNGTLVLCLARIMHKRAIIARIIYVLEKTIYRLKKTIYGSKKRLFTTWGYFCRIVSLLLITWCTFNQSMNKNIWMLYIKHCMHDTVCTAISIYSSTCVLPSTSDSTNFGQNWLKLKAFHVVKP